jgi:hypothetical protein
MMSKKQSGHMQSTLPVCVVGVTVPGVMSGPPGVGLVGISITVCPVGVTVGAAVRNTILLHDRSLTNQMSAFITSK